RARVSALHAEVTHDSTVHVLDDDWKLTSGVRGEVVAERIAATGGSFYSDRSTLNQHGTYAGPAVEAFERGTGHLAKWQIAATAAAGSGVDFAHGGDPLAYVRGSLQATGV